MLKEKEMEKASRQKVKGRERNRREKKEGTFTVEPEDDIESSGWPAKGRSAWTGRSTAGLPVASPFLGVRKVWLGITQTKIKKEK